MLLAPEEQRKWSDKEQPMQGDNRERWKQLCEQAAGEQDPKKLTQLVREINALLKAKEDRLKQSAPPQNSN